MKQIFVDMNNQIVLYDVPTPTCQVNGILVEMKYSLISSGTESKVVSATNETFKHKLDKKITLGKKGLQKLTGEGVKNTFNAALDRSLKIETIGYSGAGIVIERGKNVFDINIDDKVACAGVGYANHAEVVYVPINLAVKAPENVTFEQASFTALGSIAIQAVRQAKIQLGENVAVLGLGLIGLLLIQILNAAGCRVIGIDLDKTRVHKGEELGLFKGLVLDECNVVREAQKLTDGLGADVVIICTASKSSDPVQQAVEMVRKKGRIVVVGEAEMNIPRAPFYQKEIEFTISHSYGPGRNDTRYEDYGIDYPYAYVRWTENRNMQEFLRLVSENRIDVNALISKIYPIEQASIAYEEILKVRPKPIGVLLKYSNTNFKEKTKRQFEVYTKLVKKDKINVAVIGCGRFAKGIHIPNLTRIPGYNIRALVSRTGSNAMQTAKRFKAEYATTDYDEILKDKNIDMVLITTWHNMHAPMAIAAARAGKNVFVEKPMAITYEEYKELVKVIRETNVSFSVGYNRRFSRLTSITKQLLNHIKCPMVINYRVNAGMIPSNHWIQDNSIGGGRIIGEVCHFFDFLNYIIDDEVADIYANYVPVDNKTVNNLDNIAITIKYKNGSLAILTYTSLGDKALDKELIEIFIDGRTIVIQDFKSLRIYGIKRKDIFLKKQDKGTYNELVEFQKSLKGQPSNAVTLTDGIKATICTFKVLESLKDNTVIKLNWKEYL